MQDMQMDNGSGDDRAQVRDEDVQKYLTFYIDGQLFSIPSSRVVDIIRMQPITYMPKLPSFVKGVINIRGKIVPLIDLRLKFHKEFREYDEHTCIIVTEMDENSVGFIVDRVNDVTDVDTSEIRPNPRLNEPLVEYIHGVTKLDGKIVLFLDIQKIVQDDEILKTE